MAPDADDTVAAALAADTANRQRYLACQRQVRGLVDYVETLMRAGVVR